MAVLRIQDFAGQIPVKGDRALPAGFAVESWNTWLYGNELRGIRPPTDLITTNPGMHKVFRIPKRTVGGDPSKPGVVPPPSYLGDSIWVQFPDVNTDIIKGQLVEDSFERYYFCSPSRGPEFNTRARLAGTGLGPYRLGVPGPNITIAADGSNPDKVTFGTPSGGAAPNVTRAYLYTWVNEFGEESYPCLPASISHPSGATVVIHNIKNPPAPLTGQPNWKEKILYCTVTGNATGGTFYRVQKIAVSADGSTGATTVNHNTAADKLSDEVLVNNLRLESSNWFPPPVDLQGMVAMPNGFLIGFKGNTIYMSESYHWHAWPPEYQHATETPIVGLGVVGQTCVVCTEGYPTVVTGSKPSICAFAKVTTGEPCLSRPGIVSTPDGVLYPSQNGLILAGPAGFVNVTEQLITKEEWVRDYSPQYLNACRYQNGYLAMIHVMPHASNSGFFIDPTALKVALTKLSTFEGAHNVQQDFWSGEVLLVNEGKVQRWDPPTVDLLPTLWKSKEFQYPFQENFGAYAIYWDQARFANNTWETDWIASDVAVRFLVYADRRLVYDQTVPKNGRPIRLPSGFKADLWQFELRGRAPIYSLHVATTMKELKGV